MRLKESINQNQINLLKATYGDIKKINPNSAAVKKLMMVLKKLSKNDLETISKAKINFVSTMAQSILRGSNVSESAEMDNLQKRKNDLLKQVDPLIAKKKKLYSDVDITTPKSSDEKKLDKEIADLFSEINDLVHKIVKLKKSQNEGGGIMKEATLTEKKYYVTYNRGRGQGKDLEKEFDQKTFKTTNKPKVFNSYNDAKKYAEKMEKMFRNSIGGGTAYWVSDEKMNPIKESVNEAIAIGKMVKVVNNPHWEAALGKKGPFKRKVKMIDGDNVFFTDGSNSSMKYVKESIKESAKKFTFTKVARISNNGKLHIY